MQLRASGSRAFSIVTVALSPAAMVVAAVLSAGLFNDVRQAPGCESGQENVLIQHSCLTMLLAAASVDFGSRGDSPEASPASPETLPSAERDRSTGSKSSMQDA